MALWSGAQRGVPIQEQDDSIELVLLDNVWDCPQRVALDYRHVWSSLEELDRSTGQIWIDFDSEYALEDSRAPCGCRPEVGARLDEIFCPCLPPQVVDDEELGQRVRVAKLHAADANKIERVAGQTLQ